MAKPTFPEFKLPELKLPKLDLDALFGLQKANLAVAQETQSVVLEAVQAIVRLQHGYASELVATFKAAADAKAAAKPETVLADVKAAAEKAVRSPSRASTSASPPSSAWSSWSPSASRPTSTS